MKPKIPFREDATSDYQKVVNKFCARESNLDTSKSASYSSLLVKANDFWNTIKSNHETIQTFLNESDLPKDQAKLRDGSWLHKLPAKDLESDNHQNLIDNSRKRKQRAGGIVLPS